MEDAYRKGAVAFSAVGTRQVGSVLPATRSDRLGELGEGRRDR
jgi:hypothetical protein